ncbi:hypothetical protein PRZ48_014722 [Zasmidium cellare]|uniref:NAD(P)-binding protein n=1 Tax=Zasmidium cellare TaxID=395010 RepID=A0ABR0DZ33_ZASCE|nr:hypothetical protein PRZ48_014722 [Zasmidium cellare]
MTGPPKFPSFTAKFHNTSYPAIDPALPGLSAAGKNVVITGGGTGMDYSVVTVETCSNDHPVIGIGYATALSFATAGAASVTLIGRRATQLQSAKHAIEDSVPGSAGRSRIHVQSADVVDQEQVTAAFQKIADTVGPLNILVNGAGYAASPSNVKSANVEEWWKACEVNLKGTFLTTQAFVQHKVPDDQESVILYISSGLSHVARGTGNSAYAASKAGAIRFFTTVQLEHPETRVVCLHPGTIETDVLRKSHNVSGSVPNCDDVSLPANTMLWLASPEANFVKGKYIWANWNVEEMKARAAEIEGSDLLSMKLSGWPFTSK